MNKLKTFLKIVAFSLVPYLRSYIYFSSNHFCKLSYLKYVFCRLFRIKPYWPIEKGCVVCNHERIYVGRNSNVGRSGCYIQGSGGIYIGNYVRVTNNVGIISQNHDLYDHRIAHKKPIIIHDYCWLGTGSKVMAGVELGPRTIVAANAVVTKSVPQGNCVLAGVPAKIIKELEPEKVVHYKEKTEFYGILPPSVFEKTKKHYLSDCPFFDENGNLTIKENY